MKHLTVRFAWHDNKWNGRICKNPRMNFYCRGNYSLLSPKIQKRIDLEIEEKTANGRISDAIRENNYFPPCYWCINALGEEKCIIKDLHPFIHSTKWGKDFQRVPPLEENIDSYTLFSWCFLMSFEHESSTQIYPPIPELEERARKYVKNTKRNGSIVFFYANYSNPITGDDYKYCLLGAALLKEIEEPKRYHIPEKLLTKIRSEPKMKNFPTIAWQFKIKIDPKTAFVLPFQEYLEWLNEDKSLKEEKKWKKLKEVSTPITEHTLIPHFKYVSMHLPHDKCIYLLYYLKKVVNKMKEQQIVDYSCLEDIEKKLNELLSIAWKERSRYPGFINLLHSYLKQDFDEDMRVEYLTKLQKWIEKEFKSIDDFLNNISNIKDESIPPELRKIINIMRKNQDTIKFLSQFDFSIPQYENIRKDIMMKVGLNELKNNPYLLFENYNYDKVFTWDMDKSDYGIDLYHIDIALIPDPRYADWTTEYSAQSPQRIRALVVKNR